MQSLKKWGASLIVMAIKSYRMASQQQKAIIWAVMIVGTGLIGWYIWITAFHRIELLAFDLIQLTLAFTVGLGCDKIAFQSGGDPEDQVSETAKGAVFIRRGIIIAAFVMGISLSV